MRALHERLTHGATQLKVRGPWKQTLQANGVVEHAIESYTFAKAHA